MFEENDKCYETEYARLPRSLRMTWWMARNGL